MPVITSTAVDIDAQEAALVAGIAAIVDQTNDRIAKQLHLADEGLDTTPALAGPVGAKLTPDVSAAGPWDMALWAAAIGAADDAQEYLGVAIEHQRQFVSHLEQNLSGHPGGLRIHARESDLAAAIHLFKVMNGCAGDADALAARARHERVREMLFGEEMLLLSLSEEALCEIVPEGPEAFRQLAQRAWRALGDEERADDVAQASDQAIERSMRIARAIRLMNDKQREVRSSLNGGGIFGVRTIPSLLTTVGDRHLSDDDIAAMRHRQLDQDSWDAITFGQSGKAIVRDSATQDTARAAIAATRRMLRLSPHVARRNGWPAEDGVGIRTNVTGEALAQLHSQMRGKAGARDLRIVTTRFPGHTLTRSFAVQFHMDAEIDGRPVSLEFHAPIEGKTRSRRPDAIAKAAREAAAKAGFNVPEGPIEGVSLNPDLRPFAAVSPSPTAARGQYPSVDRLLGPERCRHESARWASDYLVGVARLECPECRRDRLAVVPLHRLPKGHRYALDPENATEATSRYLAEARVYRALEGEVDPPETLEELQRRDPPVSANPADYQIGYDDAPAPSQRSGSIEEVLGSRRRL